MNHETFGYFLAMVMVIAVVLTLIFKKAWLRISSVVLILVIIAFTCFDLWLTAQTALYSFQKGIKPNSHPSYEISYGQWFIHDSILDVLPVIMSGIAGLAVLAIVPHRDRVGDSPNDASPAKP
jgi:hypothetical protein